MEAYFTSEYQNKHVDYLKNICPLKADNRTIQWLSKTGCSDASILRLLMLPKNFGSLDVIHVHIVIFYVNLPSLRHQSTRKVVIFLTYVGPIPFEVFFRFEELFLFSQMSLF